MKNIILKHVLLNAIQYSGKADFNAVMKKILSEEPEMKKKLKKIIPEIKKIITEVNSWDLEKQKQRFSQMGLKIKEKETEEKGLPPLPNVEKYKKVVMRMAPFPSGPLHIGNARMVVLNDEYVKKYKGKLILVVDDTIGSEKKIPVPEAYDMIEENLRWLGVEWHETVFKSDRMKLFYEWAEKLIKNEHAYVCECSAEILRNKRKKGISCKCRENTIDENLGKWKKMLNGNYREGEAIVRLKTDMKYPNPAFRDRVLLRISEREHPRVGKKYRVWPMLEFSWAIDDHFLGVTHILRGKDLIIEDMMEKYIWNLLGWEHSEFIHYGLLGIEGLKLSKSVARRAIATGEYSGWDDPRTWSLQSLKKRGFRPETIRNFILSFGLSINDITIPVDVLYTENRKIVDPIANRYFVVIDPVEIQIKKAPKVGEVKASLHPDFLERGERRIPVNINRVFICREDFEKYRNKEIRLMDLFNVKLGGQTEFTRSEVDQKMPKIQWVSEDNIELEIIMSNGLVQGGLGEPEIRNLRKDDIIQMVRIGFTRVEKAGSRPTLYFSHK